MGKGGEKKEFGIRNSEFGMKRCERVPVGRPILSAEQIGLRRGLLRPPFVGMTTIRRYGHHSPL